ncbi:MAG: pyruvate:ferredoxin (flavodoxin) oxidoreductase [Sporolactobacillus sp.]
MKKVRDGNEAAAEMAYAFTEATVIYPITPSSAMAEKTERWSSELGKENLFGHPVETIQMQSEAGVAGAMHGLLKSGTLCTSFTSSQGLLLMVPALYKMVGEQLPGVIHVAARSVSSSALCIFGDHSDVMSIRQVGAVMLSSSSVQEAALMAAAAHLTAAAASLPVVHFFDGFNTSHELRKINLPDANQLKATIDPQIYLSIKQRAMRNDQPRASGASETPDIFFQQLEASNLKYEQIPGIVAHYLELLNPLFHTETTLADYYGDPNAEVLLIAMGSVSPTIHQVIDEQNALGKKYGSITLHLYRPFPTDYLLRKIPASVRKIIVLDRTKEPGSVSEPLLADVTSACYERALRPAIIGGRYGLGSKEVTPDLIRAAFFEAEKEQPKKRFTLGILDDVTWQSLRGIGTKDLTDDRVFQMKTWGFGSDGAVSCNKQTAKIIGESSDWDIQGLFWFDPKKSGNLTISHLRFSKSPIRSAYHVQRLQAVSCYCDRYLKAFDMLKGLQKNGLFLLNTARSREQLEHLIPPAVKRFIARNAIRLYTIPANQIADDYHLGAHINTIMQTCFLYLTDMIPFAESFRLLKEETRKTYADIRSEIVTANYQAMDVALKKLKKVPIPDAWYDLPEMKNESSTSESGDYDHDIQQVMNGHSDQNIPVSALIRNGLTNGSFPVGTSAKDKRDIATQIPVWNTESCIQCNLCATVCPHAAIRPFLLDDAAKKQAGFETVKVKRTHGVHYRLQVSPLDCTGCSVCVDMCPTQIKSLTLMPIDPIREQESRNWEYALKFNCNPNNEQTARQSIRKSQLQKPLLEFSGACAGCGETAYVKLLTQVFGSRMMIANATGCSSIWGCSAPSIPYTKNKNGFGPAWGTSLLEDNAEYGLGMQRGAAITRSHIAARLGGITEDRSYSSTFRQAARNWLDDYASTSADSSASERLIAAIINERGSHGHGELESLFELRHFLTKRSQWIIGGDGWAYDIDSSGIDHIFAQGDNVNLLILDNEGYSNTGGQKSKASPSGSRTRFSNTGNRKAKKDFATIAMSYENVYVAQVCIGADPSQTLRAFKEADAYEGPSVIIAYSPCVLHGITQNSTLMEEKKAVACGYWILFRRNPETDQAVSQMTIDSKEPDWNAFDRFLSGENRYSFALRSGKETFEQLLKQNKQEAQKRYQRYRFIEAFSHHVASDQSLKKTE